jgi:GntR family transcriptional regulator
VEITLRAPPISNTVAVLNRVVLSIDPEAQEAPFQQIADQLREFIERAELRPGDSLPTVRQLASDLRVAPNTVARAYADLQDNGWLVSDGRRGTRVAQTTPAADVHARASLLQDDVDGFVIGLRRRGYSKSEIRAALRRAELSF